MSGVVLHSGAEKANCLSLVIWSFGKRVIIRSFLHSWVFIKHLNVSSYAQDVFDEFGVDLTTNAFKGNKKWSERVLHVFLVKVSLGQILLNQK